jgi:hypothetical protein
MKRLLCCFCGLLLATVGARATVLFSDDFTYPNGDLVGNDGWVQTGTTTTTPVQIAAGKVVLATGQDVQNALTTPYSLVDGTPFYIGLTIDVQTAAAAGDYFVHWSPGLQNNAFISRVEIRSSGTGFNVGYVETSGTGASLTWGSTVFNFNQAYRLVVQYNPVAGGVNDTADVYMDGNAELHDTWNSITAESTTLGTLNFRQAAGNAPGLKVDDLNLTTTFAEAATYTAVPEPTSLSLLAGFGLLACFLRRRS